MIVISKVVFFSFQALSSIVKVTVSLHAVLQVFISTSNWFVKSQMLSVTVTKLLLYEIEIIFTSSLNVGDV